MSSDTVTPASVHDVVERWVGASTMSIVCDLDRSHGAYIYDAKRGVELLDFSGCFAARPLAFDHPGLADADFRERLGVAARHKVSSRQVYSVDYARFVEVFATIACDGHFRHFAFAQAEAAAVGCATRAAVRWKTRKNAAFGKEVAASKVIAFHQSFHGRIRCRPAFLSAEESNPCSVALTEWPIVGAPTKHFPFDEGARQRVEQAEQDALREIEALVEQAGGEVAGILIEPIQGEAGDRHFRSEFLASLRGLADQRDILLIFDETRTGLGATGAWWDWQNHGVQPDLMIFGGRCGVGGVAANDRLDEVRPGQFRESCEQCGTFEGDVVDMVRATRIIELIASDGLLDNARVMGSYMERLLGDVAEAHDAVTGVRARGLCIAFDMPSRQRRDQLIRDAFEEDLLVLWGGERSVRLRPTLDVDADAIARGVAQLEAALRRESSGSRR